MTQSSLFGFVNPACLLGCDAEMKLEGRFSKTIKGKTWTIIIMRCPQCRQTLRKETLA